MHELLVEGARPRLGAASHGRVGIEHRGAARVEQALHCAMVRPFDRESGLDGVGVVTLARLRQAMVPVRSLLHARQLLARVLRELLVTLDLRARNPLSWRVQGFDLPLEPRRLGQVIPRSLRAARHAAPCLLEVLGVKRLRVLELPQMLG